MENSGLYFIKLTAKNPISYADNIDFYYQYYHIDAWGELNITISEERDRAEIFDNKKLADFVVNSILDHPDRVREYSVSAVESFREEDYNNPLITCPISSCGSELLDVFMNEVNLI